MPGYTNPGPLQTTTVLSGNAGGDRFGFSVAGLGDLNGDGKAEYAVGAVQGHRSRAVRYAPHPNDPATGQDYRGYVKVFSQLNPAALTVLRPETGVSDKWATVFGSSISTIGDIDGDTVQEVIIGAPGTYEVVMGAPGDPRGAVFGYSGAEVYADVVSSHIVSSLNLFDPDPSGDYEWAENGSFGIAVAGATVNLDDTTPAGPSLISGAPIHLGRGRAFVLSADFFTGRIEVLKRVDIGTMGNHDRLGSSVALGDIYDTGEPAVVFGAHGQAVTGSPDEEGHVHLFDYDQVFP